MKANICCDCLEAIKKDMSSMTSCSDWSNICSVCRETTAVFYARKDELKGAIEARNQ